MECTSLSTAFVGSRDDGEAFYNLELKTQTVKNRGNCPPYMNRQGMKGKMSYIS